MKTLVLGLGNTILTDDGVGIHVVRRVAACHPRDDVTYAEASVGGLRLLDSIAGYEKVILVDAIRTPEGRPGDVYRLHASDLRASLHSGSTHDLVLRDALALGRCLQMTLPDDEDLVIVAIEVEDVITFGEQCTPAVAAAIPRAAEAVLAELSNCELDRR